MIIEAPATVAPTLMQTATGAYVDLDSSFNPPTSFRLYDIAHHLAQINRFTGAARMPYSVAEHSILVHDLVEYGLTYGQGLLPDDFPVRREIARKARRLALMHDAPEAYLGDVGSPLKRSLRDVAERGPAETTESEYDFLYSHIESQVYRVFDVDTALRPVTDIVHWADLWALRIEAQMLLPDRGVAWDVFDAAPWEVPEQEPVFANPDRVHLFFQDRPWTYYRDMFRSYAIDMDLRESI